jgi:hypothetical protein
MYASLAEAQRKKKSNNSSFFCFLHTHLTEISSVVIAKTVPK